MPDWRIFIWRSHLHVVFSGYSPFQTVESPGRLARQSDREKRIVRTSRPDGAVSWSLSVLELAYSECFRIVRELAPSGVRWYGMLVQKLLSRC